MIVDNLFSCKIWREAFYQIQNQTDVEICILLEKNVQLYEHVKKQTKTKINDYQLYKTFLLVNNNILFQIW